MYNHVLLPGAEHIVHFPIVNSVRDMTHGNLYLFRPREGEVAALSFHKSDAQGFEQGAAPGPFLPWNANGRGAL